MKKSLLTNRLKYLLVLLLAAMTATKAVAQEAYAELSGSTLTFYYDTNRSSRSGTTYDMNTGSNKPGWAENKDITTVTFNSSFSEYKPTSCCKWFYKLNYLTTINYLTNLCFDEVTTTQQMFQETSLTSIEFQYNNYNNYNNTAKLTNMSQMFGNNPYLQEIRNLNMFNTENVTTMDYMFYLCSKLTTLDLRSPDEKGRWNTSKVTNMQNMFYGCSNLTTIQVERGWYVGNVTNSEGMFTGCTKLVGGNGTAFNSQYTDKTYAHLDSENFPGYFSGTIRVEPYVVKSANESTLTFYYDKMRYIRPGIAYDLNSGINSPEWTDGTVTTVEFDQTFSNYNPTTTARWFENCSNLTTIDGIENLNTSKVTTMYCMFSACKNRLTELNLSAFNTAKVTDMRLMFNQCTNLKTIKVGSGWTTNAVTQSTEMFNNCTSLVGGEGTAYNASYIDKTRACIDGGTSSPGYLTEDKPEAYAVYTSDNTTLTFYYDYHKAERTGQIFKISTLFIDTGGLPNYYYSSVYDSITTVVFDNSFADARPVNGRYMFRRMLKLNTFIGLNNFNTSEITNMYGMFYDSAGLTSLDLSSFDTSKVTNMAAMFYYCNALTSLDLSSFDTSNVTNMNVMFYKCQNLRNIYVGDDWDISKVEFSNDMFNGCYSLVGSAGTTYDVSHTDASYAHIDGGTSNPGYLSAPKEAYAVYTPGNTTLSFYYDAVRGTRSGTTYSLNTITNNPGWYNDGTYQNVNTVTFDPSFADARPTTTANWFKDMSNLTNINGISYLNTSQVQTMYYMFGGCYHLLSLDLTHFDTSNVTTMSYMFTSCQGMSELDLSAFNTSKVTSMGYMFWNSGFKKLNLSSFNTEKVLNMSGMFYMSPSLTTIYVGDGWNTDKVEDSRFMFTGCDQLVGGLGTAYSADHVDKTYAHVDATDNPGYLTGIPYVAYDGVTRTLSFYCDGKRSEKGERTFDLNKGSNAPGWLNGVTVTEIKKVVFDPSFAGARPTSTYLWFSGMTGFGTIQGMEYLNTSEVTTMQEMFKGCSSLKLLNLSSFDTSNVKSMVYMFDGCTLLQTIYVSDTFVTTSLTGTSSLFTGCQSLKGGAGTFFNSSHVNADYAHIDGGTANPGYFTSNAGKEAYAINYDNTLTFYYDSQKESRVLSSAYSLYSINASTLSRTWSGAASKTQAVVFDPSFAELTPTSTYRWFDGFTRLITISGLEYLNTSEVTNMGAMFDGDSLLTAVDLSHFDTRKVTKMGSMFAGCRSLQLLDLSSFNTSNVTSMGSMFSRCQSLTELDLSMFDTSKVTDTGSMFRNCTNLTTIYVGAYWDMSNVTGSINMFLYSTNLVGGQGTVYNSVYDNKTYAHVDGGTADPGYLTLAPPYVVLDEETSTMSFYYDGKRHVRSGQIYSLNSGTSAAAWASDDRRYNITTVVFDESFANFQPTTTLKWFDHMSKLASIEGISNLNTSKVVHTAYMFNDCQSLTSLDLSSWDMSKCVNASYMFSGCTSLTTIIAWQGGSSINVSEHMFYNCPNLKGGAGTTYNANYVDKTYARIDQPASSPGYFTGLPEVYYVYEEASGIMTHYYDSKRYLREYESSQSQDVWIGEGLSYNSQDWIQDCQGCTEVVFDPSYANTLPRSNNGKLEEYFGFQDLNYVRGLEYFNIDGITTFANMFDGCSQLKELDLSSFDTRNITNMNSMFNGCSSLKTVYVGHNWTTENVTSSTDMFKDCTSIVGGAGTTFSSSHIDAAYAHIDEGTANPGYFTIAPAYVVFDPAVSTLSFYHDGKRHEKSGTVYSLNQGTDNPGWNDIASQVTQVFFDASFADVQPTSTFAWFLNMSNLTQITGMQNLNTSQTERFSRMFEGCTSLASVDFSKFSTLNMKYADAMFKNCESLTVLDLPRFSNIYSTNFNEMFYGCKNLTTIIHGGFSNASHYYNMFYGCVKLVGGSGTAYDESHVNGVYARVDRGPTSSAPGYFTARPDAYAIWDNSTRTVTHYYDNQFYTREAALLENQELISGQAYYDDRTWEDNTDYVVIDESWKIGSREGDIDYLIDILCNEYTESITGLENLDLQNVTSLAYMFDGCSKLQTLDLSSFDTRNITNMNSMFNGCSSLKTVYVGDEWTTENVTTSTDMFKDCTSIVGSAGTTFSSSHIDAAYAHVDGGTSNPGYLSELPSAYVVYDDDNTKLTFYYDGQKHLRTGTVFELNEGTDQPEWYNVMLQTTIVEFDASFAEARPTSTCQWFYGSQELTRIIGLSNLNTSEVTVMNRMFGWGLQKMPTLNLATFDTHNVTDMERMFLGCGFTTTIYVGDGWNVDNVTNSTNMFSGCISLVGGAGTEFSYTNIDKTYAHIDGGTSNPGYLTLAPEAYAVLSDDHTTFTLYCDGLKSTRTGTVYELGGWLLNTASQWRTYRTQVTTLKFDASFAEARPTSTNSWFQGMTALETIEGIEYLNTTEVTDMANMFYYCSTLKSLDLSGFYTRNVTRMDNMFFGCTALTTVYVSDEWSTENVTSSSYMFRYCSAIKGGKGTVYNINNTDAAYAHIDGGTSNPGYFTEKLDFLLGDVNGDGKITIADVTALVDIILGKDSAGTFNRLAADVNQDSSITIADVTKLVDIILGK